MDLNNSRGLNPKMTFEQRLTKFGSSMRKKMLSKGSWKITEGYVILASEYAEDLERQLHSLAGSSRGSSTPV